MADHLTLLEKKLDDLYLDKLHQLGDAVNVPNWDDYNYRVGYLAMIRKIGDLIKEVRSPESVNNGEIPSVNFLV